MASIVIYRYRFIFFILAGIICAPFSTIAGTTDPCTDCPKKDKNQQEDSVNIDESENKFIEEVQVQEIPWETQETAKAPEKTSYKTFDNNLDESDKVAEDDPNSAMSFNFIYYIIDKFKFTDPLE